MGYGRAGLFARSDIGLAIRCVGLQAGQPDSIRFVAIVDTNNAGCVRNGFRMNRPCHNHGGLCRGLNSIYDEVMILFTDEIDEGSRWN